MGVFLGGFLVGQAWLISTIISDIFIGQKTLAHVQPLLNALFLLILGRGLTTYAREISAGKVSIGVRVSLKRKLFQHLQLVSPIHISTERTGEVTTTLVQGVDRLDDYFRTYLPQLLISAILPVLVLLVVFPIDWITGIIFLVTAPLIPVFMLLIGKQAEKETTRQWKLLGQLGGHFLDVLQGLRILKAYGLSKAQGKVIREVSDQYASVTLKVLRIAFLSALVLEILATISTAVIAVQIGIRLLYGQITLVESLFILILAPEFYFPLRQLGAAFHSGMEGVRSAERIFEILAIPAMEVPENVINLAKLNSLTVGDIQYKDVRLSYQNGERPSLMGVSFSIPSDKKTAIVGPTGSGKSSILSLLLKFVLPDEGIITISGSDLRSIDSTWWRKQVAWVPQFPYLFNDTIAANLMMANPDASNEEIIIASKQAYLHDFIISLPDGYSTQIGERGARLSGGQAQRLALARAFLKDAPILIFDEPTKNLDPQTQELVDEMVNRLVGEKTIVIVAHRLSSVRTADQVIVLEDGKIVQVGKHAELIERDGIYRKLVFQKDPAT